VPLLELQRGFLPFMEQLLEVCHLLQLGLFPFRVPLLDLQHVFLPLAFMALLLEVSR